IVPRRTCAVKELPTLHRRDRLPELGHPPRGPAVPLPPLPPVFPPLLGAPPRLGPPTGPAQPALATCAPEWCPMSPCRVPSSVPAWGSVRSTLRERPALL